VVPGATPASPTICTWFACSLLVVPINGSSITQSSLVARALAIATFKSSSKVLLAVSTFDIAITNSYTLLVQSELIQVEVVVLVIAVEVEEFVMMVVVTFVTGVALVELVSVAVVAVVVGTVLGAVVVEARVVLTSLELVETTAAVVVLSSAAVVVLSSAAVVVGASEVDVAAVAADACPTAGKSANMSEQ